MESLKLKMVTTGNFARRTPTRELHVDFKIQSVKDFITKLSRQQAKVMRNYNNVGNFEFATKHPTNERTEEDETSFQSRSGSWARLNVSNWPFMG
jgi:hypothetical protein